MLFLSKIICRKIFIILILSVFLSSCTEKGNKTDQLRRQVDKSKQEQLAKDIIYTQELSRLSQLYDDDLTAVIMDTISKDLIMLGFNIDKSVRLEKHLKFYKNQDEILQSVFDWFPHHFHDCAFNIDQNLAKFQFKTNTPDSTFNKFMDLCIIPHFKITALNETIILERDTR